MVRRRARNWIIWPTVTVLFDVEDRPAACALEDVAKDADQIDRIGGDFGLGAGIVWISRKPGCSRWRPEHLLYAVALGCVLEALVLQQSRPLAAGVFRGIVGAGR